MRVAFDLRAVADALGGQVCGDQVLFPGPGHSRQDRSASLRFSAGAPGGFVVYSFAGDDPIGIRDYVRQILHLPRQTRSVQARARARRATTAENLNRAERAVSIWNEATNPCGTPVEAYLRRRNLDLPDATGEALRWHPRCPFGSTRTGCMVALVRSIVTDQPQAIHRTALSADGVKVEVAGCDRMALGSLADGAVKLTADADVTLALGVGEGIETTLSLQLAPAFGVTAVWAVLNAAGLERVPVLAGIEALWIAADNDPAGLRAAYAAADRWAATGVDVFVVRPNAAGADLNDLAIREAR